MLKKLVRRALKLGNMSWILRGVGGAVVAGIGYKLGEDLYRVIKKRVAGPEEGVEEERLDPDSHRR